MGLLRVRVRVRVTRVGLGLGVGVWGQGRSVSKTFPTTTPDTLSRATTMSPPTHLTRGNGIVVVDDVRGKQ